MHLAQLNIARLKYPIDDPHVADFVVNLYRINAIADRSEGFIWRLQDETGNATAVGGFDDPAVVVNMSVWRDAESLEYFVWNTVHKQIYRRRAEWFSLMGEQHLVMWWVEPDHIPGVAEARARLDHLRANGDSDFAFGWAHLPHVKLWQQARCA
ncbi:DUF3291 domain-containing protein [Mesorhizobium sp. IMUNJ 23232]|uniref:DUF3291 domain-containing protein n=1 Tax=Mesorhizobium sp. IMUNJ 23232 TaxID=3376064 RepID=UPI0037BBB808